MTKHSNMITSSCFYQLRCLKQVPRILGPGITASLVSAFVASRLDYCNSLLAGLPNSTIASTTGPECCGQTDHWNWLSPSHHSISPSLQWLPVSYSITTYTLYVFRHLVHIGCSPTYLTELVTAISELPSRCGIRSGNSRWCGWGRFHETETEAEASSTRPRRGSWESGRGEAEARHSENHVNVLNSIHEAKRTPITLSFHLKTLF